MHTFPSMVKQVAETDARQMKAKYDMPTPRAAETASAAMLSLVQRRVRSVCGSVAAQMTVAIPHAHRLV